MTPYNDSQKQCNIITFIDYYSRYNNVVKDADMGCYIVIRDWLCC